MTSFAPIPTPQSVVAGMDTHSATHHVAVLDGATGAVLGTREVAATRQGYALALEYATSFGSVTRRGIEGTNSYGAGVTRHLREAGQVVREVIRPNRAERRLRGKSDPLDAITAARAVLADLDRLPIEPRVFPGSRSPSGPCPTRRSTAGSPYGAGPLPSRPGSPAPPLRLSLIHI